MKTPTPKRYVVQKYVLAHSAAEALEKEKESPVVSVFLDTPSESPVCDVIGF